MGEEKEEIVWGYGKEREWSFVGNPERIPSGGGIVGRVVKLPLSTDWLKGTPPRTTAGTSSGDKAAGVDAMGISANYSHAAYLSSRFAWAWSYWDYFHLIMELLLPMSKLVAQWIWQYLVFDEHLRLYSCLMNHVQLISLYLGSV